MMKEFKIISFFFIVLCTLLLNEGCQDKAYVSQQAGVSHNDIVKGEAKSSEQSPAIKFEKVLFDFGKVGPRKKLTNEFRFINTGNSPLEITKVARCCGSVVAPLQKHKYLPGESGIIKATYTSPTSPGPLTKQLVVHSNDKTKPSVTLLIKAEVVKKITFKPSILSFRPFKEGTKNQELVIESLDEQSFSVTDLKSTSDCVSAEYDPTLKASRFVLDLRMDAEKVQNVSKGSIILTLTHPEAISATVPFEVVPRFTISPPLLIVFNAEPKKAVTRKVSVLNNYEEDFEIESLTSKDNTIRAINHRKVSNGYQFDIVITPKSTEGEMKFTDILNVNIKGTAPVPVVCCGYYAKGMSLSKAQ
jgi:hypothetical protein